MSNNSAQSATTFAATRSASNGRLSGHDESSAAEIKALRAQLQEATDILRIIRAGKIDGIVSQSPEGEAVYLLTSSDDPYRALIEHMADGAATLDAEGVVLYANRSLARMLHSPLETLIGSSIHSYVSREELAALDSALRSGLTRESKCGLTLQTTAAPPLFVVVSCAPMKIDSKNGIYLVVNDVTRLRRSETQLNEAQRLAQMGSWQWDPETGASNWSSELYRLLRRDSHLPPPNFAAAARYYTPESWAALIPRLEETIRGGEPYQLDLEMVREDGDHFGVTCRGELDRSLSEGTPRLFGTIQDITQRRAAQQALAESESRYRSLAESIPHHIFTWRADGIPDYLNPRGWQYFGVSEYETDEAPWMSFIHAEDYDRVHRTWVAAVESGSVYDIEYRLRGADGCYRWFWAHAQPFRDAGGNIVKWHGTRTDIHERKLVKNALRVSLAEKDALLQEVYHRVKNNLQVVSSLLRMQSEQANDAITKEMFRESQNRVLAMAAVHQCLCQSNDFSRIDLTSYLNNVVSHVVSSYGVATVACTVSASGPVLIDMQSAVPCGIIITELISNAIKHAFLGGKGNVSIVLAYYGNRIHLTVQDDGIGLPSEPQSPGRTGLGLELVDILVRQLGGEMRVSSPAGARFEITF